MTSRIYELPLLFIHCLNSEKYHNRKSLFHGIFKGKYYADIPEDGIFFPHGTNCYHFFVLFIFFKNEIFYVFGERTLT